MRLTIRLREADDIEHTIEFDDSEMETEDSERFEFWENQILPLFEDFIKAFNVTDDEEPKSEND